MSCHDIGRGMASVGKEVLRLYDEQKYDIHTAKELLWATMRGVNWCDGNRYEAAVSLECRCAICLKRVIAPEKELMFGSDYFAEVSGVSTEAYKEDDTSRAIEELYLKKQLLAPQICRDCYQELFAAAK